MWCDRDCTMWLLSVFGGTTDRFSRCYIFIICVNSWIFVFVCEICVLRNILVTFSGHLYISVSVIKWTMLMMNVLNDYISRASFLVFVFVLFFKNICVGRLGTPYTWWNLDFFFTIVLNTIDFPEVKCVCTVSQRQVKF